MLRKFSISSIATFMATLVFLTITFSLFGVTSIYSDIFITDFVNNIYRNQERLDQYINRIFSSLTYDHVVLFSDANLTLLEQTPSQETFLEIFQTIQMQDEFLDILVYYDDFLFASSSGIINQNNYELIKEVHLKFDYSLYIDYFHYKEETYVVKPITNLYLQQVKGIALYRINTSVFANIVNTIDRETNSFLINDDSISLDGQMITEQVLTHDELKNGNRTYQGQYQNRSSLFIVTSLSRTNTSFNFDWNVMTIVNLTTVRNDVSSLSIFLIIMATLALIATLFFSTVLIRSYIKPINRLSKKVKNLSLDHHDFSSKDDGEPTNEISNLENSYEQMVLRILALHEESLLNVETKRKLELNSLQIQINPHFLYNVLDAISWMAKIEGNKDIVKLVDELAKFYRISLHKGDNFITVKEELEIVKHFLEIQKIRYTKLFTYSIMAEDDIKNIVILKLLTQPLVENVIKHAFAEIDYVGHIEITAHKLDDKTFAIEVKDNGIGFDVDEVLNSTLGYGLKNVNERIVLEYGPEYGLRLKSEIGKGSTSTLFLPIKE